jgi:hypothetical protein
MDEDVDNDMWWQFQEEIEHQEWEEAHTCASEERVIDNGK